VELKRLQDFNKPGSQAEPGSFFGLESAFKGTGGENGYPGGVFDPLGFSRRGRRACSTKTNGLLLQQRVLLRCRRRLLPCAARPADGAGPAGSQAS